MSFLLEAEGDGTRLFFEHTGFDVTQPFGEHAFMGAEYGWAKMLKQLAIAVASAAAERN